MPPSSVVAAFTRRLAAAGFVQGAAWAACGLALAVVVVVLGGRLLGVPAAASADGHWLWLLLVPIVGSGLWRARQVRLSPADAAAHLDHRLQLGGLLLSAHEGAGLDPAFAQQLHEGLRGWRTALPAGDPLRRFGPSLGALGLLLLVLAWPGDPVHEPARAPGAWPGALRGLRERLAGAFAQGLVGPAGLAELGQKLAALAAGRPEDASAWRALDALAEQLAREQLLGGLAPAPTGGDEAGEAGRSAALEQAVERLRVFAESDGLGAMARRLLEQQLADVGDVAKDAPADALAKLRELAARFAGPGLGEPPGVPGAAADDLAKLGGLAAGLGKMAGAGARSARGEAGDGRAAPPGGGAEADAAEAAGGARAARSRPPRVHAPVAGGAPREMALPEGQPAPRPWLPIGTPAIAPAVVPSSSGPLGGAPPAGAGGTTWQLQVAPRHHAVVQRFFAADDAGPTKERR